MKSERELLAEVLADEPALRATTLESGLAEMRRVRTRRRAARTATIICAPILLLIGTFILQRSSSFNRSTGVPPQVAQAEETIPGTTIRVLSDEQLLDLFKGRPVALVGPAGNQRLILLDEVVN